MFGISIQKIIQLDHYKIKLLKLHDCCAAPVAKRLLPNFVKYAEAQLRNDCDAAPTRRSRNYNIKLSRICPIWD